jgi:hypothetical protein
VQRSNRLALLPRDPFPLLLHGFAFTREGSEFALGRVDNESQVVAQLGEAFGVAGRNWHGEAER